MRSRPESYRDGPDLRMAGLAAAAWIGGLIGVRAHDVVVPLIVTLIVTLVGALAVKLALLALHTPLRTSLATPTRAAAIVLLTAVMLSGWARTTQTSEGPVVDLANVRASVEAEIVITSDPRPVTGGFGDQVSVRGTIHRIRGRGNRSAVRSPVVILGDADWISVPLGSSVRVHGRLSPADGDLSALLSATGAPEVLEAPDVWWRGASVVRAGIRTAVEPRPEAQRVLVPSLVAGDDAGLDPALAEDFRTTGLTHLLAVSGTNLTLLVGFLLLIGRWAGVRGRARYLLGVLGIVGFVLLARTEPSVVRAAAMGAIALLAFTSNGRDRGIRTLGGAVVVLLLWDPRLSVSVGFTLSVLATAGILLLAPEWRAATQRWLPRWIAEAIAVPAAAQLACTPVVAAISGQVSLVAVLANLLVAPAVAPATVLGLAGGLIAVVWPALGQLVALPAAWSVSWIITVARWGADLPLPAVGWGTEWLALLVLTVVCAGLAMAAPHVLARPGVTVAMGVCGLLVILFRPAASGWPPEGWVMAVCQVGQGDALVVRDGPGSAIVVDVGPEPAAIDRCLTRLGVDRVSLLVLTHFHLDHVGGLPGVLDDREVREVLVSPLAAPSAGAGVVAEQLAQAGLGSTSGPAPLERQIGEVSVQQIWPAPLEPSSRVDGEGANDASVVLLMEVRGIRLLLTGDIEPDAQRRLAPLLAGLEVDVLKVPHHGSRYQDDGFLSALRARVAVVSVGEENTYGHPSLTLLDLLRSQGTRVLRTDIQGDLAVIEQDGELRTATLR